VSALAIDSMQGRCYTNVPIATVCQAGTCKLEHH